VIVNLYVPAAVPDAPPLLELLLLPDELLLAAAPEELLLLLAEAPDELLLAAPLDEPSLAIVLDEPALDEPLPPPQLPRTKAHNSSAVTRVNGEREAPGSIECGRRSAANGNRIPASASPPAVQGDIALAVAAVVVIVSVSVTALPLTVAVVGENLQVAPLGSPEQLNETLASNPPLGVSVNVAVADFPGVTVAAALDAVSANEGVDDAAEY